MNICKRCGKENQDHYKFCLGCGGELSGSASAVAGAASMAKTVVAEPSSLPRKGSPTPPGGVAAAHPLGGSPLGAPTPYSPPPAGGVAPAPLPGIPPAQPSRHPTPGAGLLNPTPFAPATRPASAPATPMAPAAAPTAPGAAPSGRICPSCGTEVPSNFVFCGACGTRLGPAVPKPSTTANMGQIAPQPRLRGRLTLIRPDGSEGGFHEIVEGENKIGRAHGAIFENDGYLSPLHAELVMNAAGAVIRDLDSLNGVFVKITAEEELRPGDVFRIGQELIRFDTIAPPAALEDGTEIMGSPNPGYWGRLSVIIGKDLDGSAFPLYGDAVTLGRERGDINFPDDGYVSGLHARIQTRGGRYFLSDLGSSNGTFVKIRGERAVQDGTFVLLGQQLFRLSITMG